MDWKEGLFISLATLVAILVLEPMTEKVLVAVSPTTAAKLGIS